MTPFFSVVIPTYNHGHFIDKCLSSVLSQSYTDWEAIVVNNYSEDNTVEIVENFRDERISLVNYRNHGIIAASRNEGIRRARGKFIAFLDSDDWWYPEKLEIVHRHIMEMDVVYHDLDIYTAEGKKRATRDWRRQVVPPVFVDLMVNWNTLPNSGVVVRKEILERVGGLTEDKALNTFEDVELWLKISRVTDRFLYIKQKLGGYWAGGGNLSQSSERHISCIHYIFDKYIDALPEVDRRRAQAQRAYLIGRIKQRTGLDKEAFDLFLRSSRSSNTVVRCKSLTLLLWCAVTRILGCFSVRSVKK